MLQLSFRITLHIRWCSAACSLSPVRGRHQTQFGLHLRPNSFDFDSNQAPAAASVPSFGLTSSNTATPSFGSGGAVAPPPSAKTGLGLSSDSATKAPPPPTFAQSQTKDPLPVSKSSAPVIPAKPAETKTVASNSATVLKKEEESSYQV